MIKMVSESTSLEKELGLALSVLGTRQNQVQGAGVGRGGGTGNLETEMLLVVSKSQKPAQESLGGNKGFCHPGLMSPA